MDHEQAQENQQATLLVVDDDEAIVELLESLFEERFDVIRAKNGWEALSLAAQHEPELVLLDVMMPGINGLTLTEELRKLPFGERLRVFVMTAHSGLVPEIERLTVDGVFIKPFEPDQLVETVYLALDVS